MHRSPREDLAHAGRIFERPAVRDDEDVRAGGDGCVVHPPHGVAGVPERERLLRADQPTARQPDVRADDVGSGLGHRGRLVGVERVGDGEDVAFAAGSDQLDLFRIAEPGRVNVPPKRAVVQPGGRNVRDPGEAGPDELVDQPFGGAVRIGCADAADDGRVLDHWEDLPGQLECERVRVPVREVAGERAVPVHPERPGVVGHEDVDSGAVGRLRDESDPGSSHHDRLSAHADRGEPLEDLRPGELSHQRPCPRRSVSSSRRGIARPTRVSWPTATPIRANLTPSWHFGRSWRRCSTRSPAVR